MGRFVGAMVGLILGYLIGAAVGLGLVWALSANTHDKSQEMIMTAIFVAGPICAVLGGIVGVIGGIRVLRKPR